MSLSSSLMEREALDAPNVIENALRKNKTNLLELIARIQHDKPTTAITIARGSSDHAATFAKYLLETQAGIITSSAAPSVYTLYQKKLPVQNALVLGISQSGASPDITQMLIAMREQGGLTVAFVNEVDSPMAKAAEFVVPILAGPEKSVAATKSYLATLASLIQFVGMLTNDTVLLTAVEQLPAFLRLALNQDWNAVIEEYQAVQNSLVIGRGFSFPIAGEAALKLKETSKIHAEAFSAAELLHGPYALIEENFPVFLFAQKDESFASVMELAERMTQLRARVFVATSESIALDKKIIHLPLPKALHAICDPVIALQAFYVMAARLSLARGLNPDAPPNLTKVTKTW